jgi:hypothetical protein
LAANTGLLLGQCAHRRWHDPVDPADLERGLSPLKGSLNSSASTAHGLPSVADAAHWTLLLGWVKLTNGVEKRRCRPHGLNHDGSGMVVPMPTARPQTAATTGFVNELMPREKRKPGESWVDGGLFKSRNIVTRTEDGFVTLDNRLSHPYQFQPHKGRQPCAYMTAVMEFFLSTRLIVNVNTPASRW